MITDILVRAGEDPTGFVGGMVTAWGGHLRPGGEELFVVEADEFDRSFHYLQPSVALVTNLDAEHLDVYGDLEGVTAGFGRFLERVREGGTVLVCSDDPGAAALAPPLGTRVRSYGFSAGSQIRGVEYEPGRTESRFRVIEDGEDRGAIHLRVAGRHNATNALGAAAIARVLGVGWPEIRDALAAFGGVVRRFQLLGEAAGVVVVDDYAHHPKEIDVALAAARESYPGTRLVVAFQPHLYTRTRDFAREFGEALAMADVIWITEVYPARESPIRGVDGRLVAREVEGAIARGVGGGSEVHFHGDLASFPEALASELRAGDLCLTLGAGSVECVGPGVLRRLEVRATEAAHA
jgi:UDP-N-acetylmuramate--alanine ligase